MLRRDRCLRAEEGRQERRACRACRAGERHDHDPVVDADNGAHHAGKVAQLLHAGTGPFDVDTAGVATIDDDPTSATAGVELRSQLRRLRTHRQRRGL